MGNFQVKNVSGKIQFFGLDGREFKIFPGCKEMMDGKYRNHPVLKSLIGNGTLELVGKQPTAPKPVQTVVEVKDDKVPAKEENHPVEQATEPQTTENEPETEEQTAEEPAEEETAFQCCGTTQSGSRCRRKVVMTQSEYDAAGGEVFCPAHKE